MQVDRQIQILKVESWQYFCNILTKCCNCFCVLLWCKILFRYFMVSSRIDCYLLYNIFFITDLGDWNSGERIGLPYFMVHDPMFHSSCIIYICLCLPWTDWAREIAILHQKLGNNFNWVWFLSFKAKSWWIYP